MAMERYLITGASRGIGRAIALRLAEAGRILLLHGRDKTALEKSCHLVKDKGGEVVPIVADLGNLNEVEVLIRKVGSDPLQVLVNNAGVAFVKPFDEVTLVQWQQTLAVNVTAPFLLMQRLLPLMPKGASIVNILSIAARVGSPNWSSYCMSKFALEGLSQSVREELRPRGIRLITIYPAATTTDIWNNVPGTWPREKMLKPEEVAEAVHFALTRPSDTLVETITVGNLEGKL